MGFVAFIAILQVFLIVSLLNGSLTSKPTAVIRISYSTSALHMNQPVEMGYPRVSLLQHALAKIHSKAMAMERNQENLRERALQALKDHSGSLDLQGTDQSLLCQAMATQEATLQPKTEPHPLYFKEGPPKGPKLSSGVILSSYFGSKVDPKSCLQYTKGRLPQDSYPHLRPLNDAVERMGLEAVVFHDDALSEDFVHKATTPALVFQKVALEQRGWSSGEERWAIVRDWLDSDAAEHVEWVLVLDLDGWTMASNPFNLMESSDWGWFNLWMDALPATDAAVSRFQRCYGTQKGGPNLAPPLHVGNQTFNSGVVGGTRASILELASALLEEFEIMEQQRKLGLKVWNCEAPALHHVMREGGPLAGQRVFARGHPFVGDANECALEGQCDYVIYRDA